jgi:hypothetical protein
VDSSYTTERFLPHALQELRDDAAGCSWIWDNREAIEVAHLSAKESRLFDILTANKTTRTHDDLSRAFYKALSELRKHQEWRRRRPIDITPEPHEPQA